MAAVRPAVLVFQELASVNATAESPSLETLIAGPCYHIQDYPADRATIQVLDYGSVDAACDLSTGSSITRPAELTEAFSLMDAPNNVVGAELDHSSVRVYAEDVRVEVLQGTAGSFGTVAPEENLFSVVGATFYASGVRRGDRLIVTSASGVTTIRVIQEVGAGAGSALPAHQLRVRSNYTDAETTALAWRVERELPIIELPQEFVGLTDNEITIRGGVTHVLDLNGDGIEHELPVNFAKLFVEYRSLRKDLAAVNVVQSTDLTTVLGRVDERNPLAAGASVALANTLTSIQVFGVAGDDLNGKLDKASAYEEMLAILESRTDTYAVVPLVQDLEIVSMVHEHAVAYSSPEKSRFRVVYANAPALPTQKVVEGPSVLGTTEIRASDVVSVFVDAGGNFADGGVTAGDSLVVVSDSSSDRVGTYEIQKVYDNHRLYVPTLPNQALAGTVQYYVLRGAQIAAGYLSVEITGANTVTLTSGTVSTDDVGKVLRLVGDPADVQNSPVGNSDYLITTVDVPSSTYTVVGPDLVSGNASAGVVTPLVARTTAASCVTRKAFRVLLDNSASFSANGVIAGDLLEIPVPASAGSSSYDSVYTAVVSAVVSDNRLELVVGSDIPTLSPATAQVGTVGYRVNRSLTKAGQKEELLRVVDPVTGIRSKRLVLVWPDECLLSSVQNEKSRTKTRQPGYYIACALGGLSAGLPPHQGFTFVGINGVSEIFHSSRYFRESDLEAISNAGYMLFQQDSTVTTPFCAHQLTTDTSALETGELSIVRAFDYVSRFYKGVLDQFIGRYNVNAQTLDILRETINTATGQLRGQTLPRIGAPIVDAQIRSVAPLSGQKDRVEIYMDVQLAAPLNRIGLYLVA